MRKMEGYLIPVQTFDIGLAEEDRPKRMVHPISSLINPHTTLAKQEEENAIDKMAYEKLKKDIVTSPLKLHVDIKVKNRIIKQNQQKMLYSRPSSGLNTGYPLSRSVTPSTSRSASRSSCISFERSKSAMSYLYEENKPKPKKQVGLDLVIDMVDDVAGGMICNIEETILSRPGSGQRIPSANILPYTKRPYTAHAAISNSPALPNEIDANTQEQIIKITQNANMNKVRSLPPDLSGSVSPVTQAVDWRGCVTPDSTHDRATQKCFKGHSYMKTLKTGLKRRERMYGFRPKTALVSTSRMSKDCRHENRRTPGQASSHMTTEISDDVMSDIMTVRSLDSGRPRPPPSESSDYYAQLFKRDSKYHHTPTNMDDPPVPREFVTFVASKDILRGMPTPRRHTNPVMANSYQKSK